MSSLKRKKKGSRPTSNQLLRYLGEVNPEWLTVSKVPKTRIDQILSELIKDSDIYDYLHLQAEESKEEEPLE